MCLPDWNVHSGSPARPTWRTRLVVLSHRCARRSDRRRDRDGSLISVPARTTVIRDESGEPVAITSINRAAPATSSAARDADIDDQREFRRALDLDEFEIYYQPFVALADLHVVAVEALVRWNHPALGLCDPAGFIKAAERSGLIVVVDDAESNVVLLERILKSAGVGEVKVLTDFRLVAECCQSRQPHLIMRDLHMPFTDGIAVLNLLSAILPEDSFVDGVLYRTPTPDPDNVLYATTDDLPLREPLNSRELVFGSERCLLRTSAISPLASSQARAVPWIVLSIGFAAAMLAAGVIPPTRGGRTGPNRARAASSTADPTS